jgi:hypothetical protein
LGVVSKENIRDIFGIFIMPFLFIFSMDLNNSTIKVSKHNLNRLHQYLARLTLRMKKKMTLDDAISDLLDRSEKEFDVNDQELELDRKKFLERLKKQKIIAHGIEDFEEFDVQEARDSNEYIY